MTADELAKKMDVTLVRNCHTETEIRQMIEAMKKYRFACAFTLQCYLDEVKQALSGPGGIHVGGVAGFPSGGEFTQIKCAEARTCMQYGADELDMVINLGWMLSGRFDAVRDEIKQVKEIVGGKPLKCIIEMSCLGDELSRRACEIAVSAGADYIKTGTGWFGPATVEGVRLIRETVGDAALIKAAGGIRTPEQARALVEAGASRLGIGLASAVSLMENGNKNSGR